VITTTVLRRAALKLILAFTFTVHALSQESVSIESHDVQFVSHNAILKGSIFMPEKSPIVAAIVLVHGAGKAERMRGFGSSLARLGLAVLTYDKRGVGKSGGIYAGPEVGTNNVTPDNLDLLADDAAAAMRRLHLEKHLGAAPLGFIGFSQAGWIVPLAALKNHRAGFMVLFSGAAETTHEDVLFEQAALHVPDFWDHHTHDQVRAMMATTLDKIEWPNFDPRTALSQLKIPGLWMYGGRDRNVDVDLSVERLKELIESGHGNYRYRLFPDYDHELGNIDIDVLGPTMEWIEDSAAGASRQPD
jgi:uncharacterized protein